MEIVQKLDLRKLKDSVQSGNVSFLVGSGTSRPYLNTLESIERDLTNTEDNVPNEYHKTILLVRDYFKYMEAAMFGNIELIEARLCARGIDVLSNYRTFINTMGQILQKRSNSLLSRQTNIFTTNIDLFFETALESEQAEYSDGFHGRFKPKFDTSNYRKSYFKQSLHYDHKPELPVFNLLKMHGSLSWELSDGDLKEIEFSKNLESIKKLQDMGDLSDRYITEDFEKEVEDQNYEEVKVIPKEIEDFMRIYETLQIVNPTKNKFGTTVLNRTYYDLLRVYSNSLEKENTVLFVLGFSFADEHVRDITVRAANSNPTLVVYVFAHTNSSALDILSELDKHNITNNNVIVVAPEIDGDGNDEFNYDLSTINDKVFGSLLKMILGEGDNSDSE